ncbi:unnamed protein product, partial [Rotaria socialis]
LEVTSDKGPAGAMAFGLPIFAATFIVDVKQLSAEVASSKLQSYTVFACMQEM